MTPCARLPVGRRLSYDERIARHPVSFAPGVAARSEGLNTIQGGPFALRDAELARLREKGFTLVPRMSQGSFLTGYVELYLRDQPVYVSADVILNALHEGFDSMMIAVETDALAPALTRSLERLRASLGGAAGASLPADTRADLDVYLAVTLGLLQGALARTVANGRLPTEAEWEYAARGRTVSAEGLSPGRTYPWGMTDPDDMARVSQRQRPPASERDAQAIRRTSSRVSESACESSS